MQDYGITTEMYSHNDIFLFPSSVRYFSQSFWGGCKHLSWWSLSELSRGFKETRMLRGQNPRAIPRFCSRFSALWDQRSEQHGPGSSPRQDLSQGCDGLPTLQDHHTRSSHTEYPLPRLCVSLWQLLHDWLTGHWQSMWSNTSINATVLGVL